MIKYGLLMIMSLTLSVVHCAKTVNAKAPVTAPNTWCGEKFELFFTEVAKEKMLLDAEFKATEDEVMANIIAGKWVGLEIIERQALIIKNANCKET